MASSSGERDRVVMTTPTVAVCLKWTAQHGEAVDDVRFAGISDADQAALEVALRLAEQLGATITAIAVGPVGADTALRDAISCGAHGALRVDAPADLTSEDVARELSAHLVDAAIVVCGDASTDRGSGSVPAFVAHRLGRAQALGLVAIDVDGTASPAALGATRRLDGGRRERLRVPMPCVVSVEGAVASLRRASLRSALAARTALIDVVPMAGPPSLHTHGPAPIVSPYRPRARELAAPAGDVVLDRMRALLDATGSSAHGETVVLDPHAAAVRIVAALREWGYLTP